MPLISKSSVSLNKEELVFTLAVAATTAGYLAYYFLGHAEGVIRRLNAGCDERRSAIRKVVFQRLAGVVFLGLFPVAVMLLFLPPDLLRGFGLGLTRPGQTLLWSAGLSALVIALNFFNARKPSNLEMYPQIRITDWTYGDLAVSGLTWALYLLAYEILFRGILFVPLAPVIGLVPAVTLNAAVYALAHLPKGMKESVGAIPFGIVVCLITWSTGNIWTAFWIHSAMALSNEWLSLYFHPEMKLQ